MPLEETKSCLTAPGQNSCCAVRFLKYWAPVLLVMGAIFRASSVPGTDIPPLFPYQDIVYHFSVYSLLAYFAARALKNTCLKLTLKNIIYIAVAFGIFYSITDECHQLFVPRRSASFFDLVIDALGSIAGSFSQAFLLPILFRQKSKG